jgi:hypothetical protein
MTKRRLGARTALVVGMAASLLVSVAALPAALSVPDAAGGHRARLTLRGGGKAPEAPAVKLPPRGWLARRFEKFVTDTFESVDVDKSGTVDLHEFHVLVLELYLKLNREAPVEPPTREVLENLFKDADKGWLCVCVMFCVLCVVCGLCDLCVRARACVSACVRCTPVQTHARSYAWTRSHTHSRIDSDKSGSLSKDEFVSLATKLIAANYLRVAAHKFMTVAGGPLFGAYCAHKITGDISCETECETEDGTAISGLHMMLVSNLQLILTVLFVFTLGNVFLKIFDFVLLKLGAAPAAEGVYKKLDKKDRK